MKLRVVIDTNIIISAIFWGNQPREIISRAISDELQIIANKEIIAELQRVLNYPKFSQRIEALNTTVEKLVQDFEKISEIVTSIDAPDIVRDPKDRIILAAALAGKADFIITGDEDLLVLNPYEQIQILKVVQFLEYLNSSKR